MKDTKLKVADLEKLNDSIKKEKTDLEVRVKASIENIIIKEQRIETLEKETESFNLTLKAKEGQIKIKHMKIVELEKETQSLNGTLASKEKEIETCQKVLISLKTKNGNCENKNTVEVASEKLQCDLCNFEYIFQNQIEAHTQSQHCGKRKDEQKYTRYKYNVCYYLETGAVLVGVAPF